MPRFDSLCPALGQACSRIVNCNAFLPQGRPWSVGGRSVVVQLLLAGLALWAAATAAAALGAAWHALSGAAGHSRPKAAATKYVLVIDSGSSGTRMYAYNWTLPAARQQGAAGSILPLLHPIPPSAAPHLVPEKEKKGARQRAHVHEWGSLHLQESSARSCRTVNVQISHHPDTQHRSLYSANSSICLQQLLLRLVF